MYRSKLINEFEYNRTVVSLELLKDALELYESGLDRVVKSAGKKGQDGHIPGMGDFSLCDGIVKTYYQQNPGFDYRDLREGFTPEQMSTLQNIQGDVETQIMTERNQSLRRYDY